jgi:quinol monooxygenase YgiN
MKFVQIIEFTTSRLDEVEALMDKWVAESEGRRSVYRSDLTTDRDRSNSYVQIVEFSSYEDAMQNSALPETAEFATSLNEVCDTPPKFRNLDIVRTDNFA